MEEKEIHKRKIWELNINPETWTQILRQVNSKSSAGLYQECNALEMSQEHATYTQRIEQKTKNKIFYFPEIQNFVSRKKFDASAHSNSNKEHDM